MDRDSSVRKATRHDWIVRGSKPGGNIFRTRPDRPWCPTQPPIQSLPGLFPGVKRQGSGVDHPPPSSAVASSKVNFTFNLRFSSL